MGVVTAEGELRVEGCWWGKSGEFQCILLVDLYQRAETAEALPNVTAALQYQYD